MKAMQVGQPEFDQTVDGLIDEQMYYTRFSTNPATRSAGLPQMHQHENRELARINKELAWMPGSEKHVDPIMGSTIVDENALYGGLM